MPTSRCMSSPSSSMQSFLTSSWEVSLDAMTLQLLSLLQMQGISVVVFSHICSCVLPLCTPPQATSTWNDNSLIWYFETIHACVLFVLKHPFGSFVVNCPGPLIVQALTNLQHIIMRQSQWLAGGKLISLWGFAHTRSDIWPHAQLSHPILNHKAST